MKDDSPRMNSLGIRKRYHRKKKWLIALAGTMATVVIMVIIWWGFPHGREGAGVPHSRGVEFEIQVVNSNWSMVVSYAPYGCLLTETTLTIRNQSGLPIGTMSHVALSELTLAHWNSYKAVYLKVGVEATIIVGASILVEIATYPIDSYYELRAQSELVGRGDLR